MKIFGRKKIMSNRSASALQDRAAQSIAGLIVKLQHCFVLFMVRLTRRRSKFGLKIWLVTFSLTGFGLSAYFFTGAITRNDVGGIIKIHQLRLPPRIEVVKKPKSSAVMDSEIPGQLKRLRVFMDSLSRESNGQKVYDSILKARPNFMDSLEMMEAFYLSQFK